MSPRSTPASCELPQALREEARLGHVRLALLPGRGLELDVVRRPALSRPVVGRVRYQELGCGASAQRLAVGLEPCLERREGLAEHHVAEEVDRCEDLGPRPEVAAERELVHCLVGARGGSLLAEHLEVGVAKPVDRLVLVPDDEEPRLGAAEGVDQLELDTVRVLELVHHQMGEAGPPRLGHGTGAAQELQGTELEIREVGARALRLELSVAVVVRGEQRGECGQALNGAPLLERSELRGLVLLLDGSHGRAGVRQARRIDALAAQLFVDANDEVAKARQPEGRDEPGRRLALAPHNLLDRRRKGPFAKT